MTYPKLQQEATLMKSTELSSTYQHFTGMYMVFFLDLKPIGIIKV